MSTEELKMIIDLLNGLGQGTLTAVVWYYVYLFVKYVLALALASWGIHVAYKLFSGIINSVSHSVAAMKTLRDMLDCGSSGTLTVGEIRSTLAELTRIIKRQSSNKL